MCGLQSNLTNGFLNKYGSLICNQKDMRMAEATTATAEAEAEAAAEAEAEEGPRKCMPMAVGGHGTGSVGAGGRLGGRCGTGSL